MPRCNLTLKQKLQLIDLSQSLPTNQLAKKFRVHTTTVTRTIQKKEKILHQASRINPNFKTVQTNMRSEEHDSMVLDFIKNKQKANVPISVSEICDKAVEFATILDRQIKSQRAWWRRFRIRCNVVRVRVKQKQLAGTCFIETDNEANRNDSGYNPDGEVEAGDGAGTSKSNKLNVSTKEEFEEAVDLPGVDSEKNKEKLDEISLVIANIGSSPKVIESEQAPNDIDFVSTRLNKTIGTGGCSKRRREQSVIVSMRHTFKIRETPAKISKK